jgi:hypothetical protein
MADHGRAEDRPRGERLVTIPPASDPARLGHVHAWLTGTITDDGCNWTADSTTAEISGFFAPPDASCPPYGIDVLLSAPSSGS